VKVGFEDAWEVGILNSEGGELLGRRMEFVGHVVAEGGDGRIGDV